MNRICMISVLLVTCMAASLFAELPNIYQVDPGEYTPQDATAVFSIPDVPKLAEQMDQTSLGRLLKDPAMKPFVKNIKDKLRKFMDEKMDDEFGRIWRRADLGPLPDEIPWPRAATVILRQQVIDVDVARYDFGNWDPEKDDRPPFKGYDTKESISPGFCVILDCGENIEMIHRFLEAATDYAVEEGSVRKERTQISGFDVGVMHRPKIPEDARPHMKKKDTVNFTWCAVENTLLCAYDLKTLENVLPGLRQSGSSKLGDLDNYGRLFARTGKGQIHGFVNIPRMLRVQIDLKKGMQKAALARTFESLGLKNLTGAAMSIGFSKSGLDTQVKAFLGIDGEPQGLVKMLIPDMDRVQPEDIVTEDDAMFVTANYNAEKVYEEVCKLTQQMSGLNLDAQLQQSLSQAFGANQPPLNMREDVFANMSGPLWMTLRHKTPDDADTAMHIKLAMEVDDSAKLNNALGRLHGLIGAGVKEQTRREVRGQTLYLLPFEDMFGVSGQPDAKPDEKNVGAYAVIDRLLVFSSEQDVMQEVRNAGRLGKRSIMADPKYRAVAQRFPSQVAAAMYENERVGKKTGWKRIRTVASEMEALPDNQDPLTAQLIKIYRLLELSLLPEFEQIEEYWNVSGGYMAKEDDGVYLDLFRIPASLEKN